MRKITCIMLFGLAAAGCLLYSQTERVLPLDQALAEKFAAMARRCIQKEYPNKPSQVLADEKDILSPSAQHPAFYGCFDWHSSVHGHWLLVRLLKLFPDLSQAKEIRAALNRNLCKENIEKEALYLEKPDNKSFERTYGWAWLLKLVEELHGWDDPDGKKWRQNLVPLETRFVSLYLDFLPKQTYPIRTGVHPNTAFGLAFALDYARQVGNTGLEALLVKRSRDYFLADKDCPAGWEPGGEDFFSPCLMEADLMRRVLDAKEFYAWFSGFLPGIKSGQPEILLHPAMVTDRSDGKLVHLDGLNLSRAWCMKHIAGALPAGDPAREALLKAYLIHAEDGLKNVGSGDYAGEHWLASFAVYLLSY